MIGWREWLASQSLRSPEKSRSIGRTMGWVVQCLSAPVLTSSGLYSIMSNELKVDCERVSRATRLFFRVVQQRIVAERARP